MNDISNGNWELRRENMFHSIIEEQLSTATLSMFDCASLVPQNFALMRLPSHISPSTRRQIQPKHDALPTSNLAPPIPAANKEGPFAVRDLS